MIARAEQVTLVLDSSKFGVSSLATICQLGDVDTVIADEGALEHHETVEALEEAGVELVIASDGNSQGS